MLCPDHTLPDHTLPDHTLPDHTLPDHTLAHIELGALVRRLAIPTLVVIAGTTTVLLLGGRVHAIAQALRRGLEVNPGWAATAPVFEFVSLAGYVALLSLVAGRATPRIGGRESAQITLAGAAATRLVPTAGAGGAALTLWSLRRAGLPSRTAARTLLVFLVLLYCVFLALVALSGAALALGLVDGRGPRSLSAIAAIVALAGIGLGLLLAVSRGTGSQDRSSRVTGTTRLIGDAVRDACRLVGSRDPRLTGAIVYWLFDAAVLWAMLHALSARPVIPVVLLAYFVGQAATTLPIPGSVSGGITGVLVAFGVPIAIALPSVLAYRAVAVWLPSPIALAAVPRLRATITRWRREDAAVGARD